MAIATTQPSLALPDISQMEAQLKTQGSLLSEITVQANQTPTPLQHLQPNLIQMPSEPVPSASPVIPLVPITLASTAPAAQPTAQPTTPAKSVSPTPEIPNEGNVLKPILKISALISILVLGAMGLMMWQTNPLSQASSTEPTASQPLWSGWFTQFTNSDGTSNTINIDQESSTFKWYQSP